ncbi:MAG: hypothetical protein J1E34_07850 [Oscillospiraceae bacterium]|nr:hypothetical protein [Oscillospiraceae bacterium]
MKYKSKFLSLFLAFCILFAFSGCLKYSSNLLDTATSNAPSGDGFVYNPGTTSAPDPTSETLLQEPSSGEIPSSEPSSVPESSTEAPESTTLPIESTSAPAESTSAPAESTTESSPASWSKAEVIAFLTEAVNKTKAYTGTITAHRTEDLGVTVENISPNIPAVKSIANSIISRVVKPVDETLTFTGGTCVDSEGETLPLLLPKRQNFVLSESEVSSAKASSNGNNIVVEIALISELGSLTQIPTANAGTIGYLDISDIDLSMLTIEKLDIEYRGSTIKAVVNSNGYVVSADYYVPIGIDASGKALGFTGAFACSGYQIETWEINW